jgi:hypothetical protein
VATQRGIVGPVQRKKQKSRNKKKQQKQKKIVKWVLKPLADQKYPHVKKNRSLKISAIIYVYGRWVHTLVAPQVWSRTVGPFRRWMRKEVLI